MVSNMSTCIICRNLSISDEDQKTRDRSWYLQSWDWKDFENSTRQCYCCRLLRDGIVQCGQEYVDSVSGGRFSRVEIRAVSDNPLTCNVMVSADAASSQRDFYIRFFVEYGTSSLFIRFIACELVSVYRLFNLLLRSVASRTAN